MSTRFPGRRFSVVRLLIAMVVAGLLVASGLGWWNYTERNSTTADPWFGGYVDATATPIFEFESLTANQYQNLVLSFVVAENGACAPSWGNYYTPDAAARELDLDRRVARVVQNGHDVVVSFGGLNNTSLAQACTTPESLADAYASVLQRYGSHVIDLDIENEALTDRESRQRRVSAVKQVQERMVAEGDGLGVWLTLPADANGLTGDGIDVVREFIEGGVTLSGVNLMVMNFGVASQKESQAHLSTMSLNAAHTQVRNLYWFNGELFSDEQIWRRLGATPMIGQNDHADEVFTLTDAGELRRFAAEVGLGRLSFWSLNRDEPCDANYPNQSVAATFCSGINQTSGQFAQILSEGFTGGAASAALATHHDSSTPAEVVEDDPETSPYPIWDELASYPVDAKIVWKGNVYVSRWWTRGDRPDLPAAGGQSPWRLIGPVMPGDVPIPEPKLPADFYPAWVRDTVYHRGDRVIHEGEAYEAKWWTQSDSPDAGLLDPGSSPWAKLSAAEIQSLMNGTPALVP